MLNFVPNNIIKVVPGDSPWITRSLNPLTTNVPLMEHPKNLCLVIGKCLGSLFYGVLLHYYAILTRIDPFQKFRIGPVKGSSMPK